MSTFEIAAGYTTSDGMGRNITTSLREVEAETISDAVRGLIPNWWTVTYADGSLIVAEFNPDGGALWFQCNRAVTEDHGMDDERVYRSRGMD